MELLTGENDSGRRLDRVLRKALGDYPLPLIHRLLRQGKVLVDGKPGKAQDRVAEGVKINITLKASRRDAEPQRTQEKIKRKTGLESNSKLCQEPKLGLDLIPVIIWQTQGLIAFYKPAGLAVHGPNSLDTIVRNYLADKLPPSLSFAPGPLHRLDKGSSGIVVFSTSLEGARLFSSLMRERKVKKTYLAIVEGRLEKEQVWEDYLARDKSRKKTFILNPEREKKIKGKNAVTRVIPVNTGSFKGKDYTLIKAEIETGRTHQIRAQASFHGHPLAGDRKYGSTAGNVFKNGFFLHGWKMEFLGNKIESPLPEDFVWRKNEVFPD